MQSYKRKITYFFQYHNGNIGSTAGFLKLEIRGDKVKVNINIQEPADLPYKEATLYFYHEAGDHLVAVAVDRIESQNGILTYQKRTNWQQMYDTDRDLYTFDGVAVMYNESHYYIGDFKDKSRRDYPLVIKQPVKSVQKKTEAAAFGSDVKPVKAGKYIYMGKEQAVKGMATEAQTQVVKGMAEEQKSDTEGITSQGQKADMEGMTLEEQEPDIEESVETQHQSDMKTVSSKREQPSEEKGSRQVSDALQERRWDMQEEDGPAQERDDELYKCENCPYMRKRWELQDEEDAFDKMLREYPKLPMYGVTELFDCVRIHPRDIGKLDMRNWKLGVNSFLTHGFYTYQYLLLGKMRFGKGADRPIIGVPGVYSNREKYLANMFGFDQFVPVKKTGIKTGEFGYWIVEISPYL